MIDFRYHLVSIVAIFLALAVGIVVGAAALRPGLLKGLELASNRESRQVRSLLSTQRGLEQQIKGNQDFAKAGSGLLLEHLLTGQRVVLVTAPGADGQTVSGITGALQQAGAHLTGEVSLQQSFFDISAGNESRLNLLAQRLAPPGLSLDGQAANPQIPGQQSAAQVIATALVTGKSLGWSAAESQQILSGFGPPGYLQVSKAGGTGGTVLSAPATLAVVVIPATPLASDSDPVNLTVVALAQQLRTLGAGVVVAGQLQGSGNGSAIDEIGSGSASADLSTVDNADTEIGQITVVQALRSLLNGAKPASYGIAPDAFPSPAPSPVPTVSADPATATPADKHSVKP